MGALKKIKGVKASGLESFPKGNGFREIGTVSEGSKVACIIPVYNSIEEKSEYTDYL